jgi:hypothetical protein
MKMIFSLQSATGINVDGALKSAGTGSFDILSLIGLGGFNQAPPVNEELKDPQVNPSNIDM